MLPPWPSKITFSDPVRIVAFSDDLPKFACGCSDGSIRLWDAWNGERKEALGAHRPGARAVALAFTSDGTTLA